MYIYVFIYNIYYIAIHIDTYIYFSDVAIEVFEFQLLTINKSKLGANI